MQFQNTFAFDNVFDLRTYPVGEPHIFSTPGALSALAIAEYPRIICDLIFSDDLGANPVSMRDFNGLSLVRMADAILKRHGILAEFIIPYMPFGRHDRRESSTDGFPIDILTHILDGVNVTVIDPHSDVTGNPFRVIDQCTVVRAMRSSGQFVDAGGMVPIIPDAGATKKAYTWTEYFDEAPVQCVKHRDPATGKLSGFGLADPTVDLTGKSCLIIDDICDGGGTFLGVADVLRNAGAEKVALFVTHGFFTKGLSALSGLDWIGAVNYNHRAWPTDNRTILIPLNINDVLEYA